MVSGKSIPTHLITRWSVRMTSAAYLSYFAMKLTVCSRQTTSRTGVSRAERQHRNISPSSKHSKPHLSRTPKAQGLCGQARGMQSRADSNDYIHCMKSGTIEAPASAHTPLGPSGPCGNEKCQQKENRPQQTKEKKTPPFRWLDQPRVIPPTNLSRSLSLKSEPRNRKNASFHEIYPLCALF